jgi:putative nucleotidyltransferase with HDIG domain
MRIADDLGLSNRERANVFFASLLKDSGCSNNSVRINKIFGGDELLNKRDVKYIDWSNTLESLAFAVTHTERGKSLGEKLRKMVANLGPPDQIMREVTEARCTRGAQIAQLLGFGHEVAEGIQCLDEHWDGRGAPRNLKGDAIPLISRIVGLAQTFEVFLSAFGLTSAYEMIQKRSGRWFDPEIVAACRAFEKDNLGWERFGDHAYEESLSIELPDVVNGALDAEIDDICSAFALIVDAKSSFTAQHSTRVAQYAVQLADWFGFDKERRTILQRAALLHDIGKLGIPTGILEKPGKLDNDEFDRMKSHPELSFKILRRVPSFSRIAEIASTHHERLDGRGYWQGLTGDHLDLEMRILTVSDVFDALTANRPYRDAVPIDKTLEIMNKDEGTAFDPECLRGLHEIHLNTSGQTSLPKAA